MLQCIISVTFLISSTGVVCPHPENECYFCYAILLFLSLYFTGLDSSLLLQPSHTVFFARLKDIVVTDVDSRTLHKKVHNYKILSFTWFFVSFVCIKVKFNTYSFSTLLKYFIYLEYLFSNKIRGKA